VKNKNNKIANYKVSYEFEKRSILSFMHIKQGHAGYMRLYK